MEKTAKCSRIEQIWESFVVAEHNSYERSSWFDIFLSEFLIEIKDGKQPSEILSFSSTTVIASAIAAEFLTEVHDICSQPGDEEVLSRLRQHLLNGRGWRSLAVLQCLGVQDVSCSQELASLFICINSIFLHISVSPDSNEVLQKETSKNPFISQISKASFRSLDDIIKLKSPRVRKKSSTHALSNDSGSSGSRNRGTESSSGPRSKFKRNSFHGPVAAGICENESSDTDALPSFISDSTKNTANKSSLIKLRFNTFELDDFPSVSENENGERNPFSEFDKQTKESLNPNDFISNNIRIVLKNRLNVFELSHLLINLLSDLCLAQNIAITSSSDNLQQLVIVQALNFSLENLCSLQFNAAKNKHFSPSEVYLLKLSLLKLLLQIVHKMKDQLGFSAIILNSGVVPILIRLLEDIVPKYTKENVEKPPVEPQILQEFIFGSLYLLTLILDYFLKQKSFLQKDKTSATNDKLFNFLQIFQNVVDSHNGKLMYKIIEIILNFPSINFKITDYRIKKVIFLIGEMIVTMKRIRAKINHNEKCKRSKHKQCLSSYLVASSHHHDSFGHVYTNKLSLISNSPVKYICAVTSLTSFLVKLLSEKLNSELFSYILQVLKMSGTCCCFNISDLLCKLLNILNLDLRCTDLALKVLEEKMFYDLGVIEGVSQCKICFGKLGAPHSSSTDSSLACFIEYRKLFQSPEIKISKPIGIHLLKLVPLFIKSIQRTLLSEVFYPSFVKTKTECNLTNLQKSEKSLMVNSLSAFINLINYGQLHEEFIQLGGIKHLEDLITIHDFTKLCALILETIILVKISSSRDIKIIKSELEGSKGSKANLIEMSSTNEGSVEEFEVIISHLYLVQQEFLSILSDCRFESRSGETESEMIHKMSIEESILNNLDYSHTEKSITFDVILNDLNQLPTIVFRNSKKLLSYTNLLNILSELWRSCTNIILISSSMEHIFRKLPASQHCSTMICILLRLISKEFYVSSSMEFVKVNTLHFKLLEALIPLHLALSSISEITNMIENELKSSLTLVIKNNRVTLPQICDLLTKCAVKISNKRQSLSSASANSLVICTKSMSYVFNGMEEEAFNRKRQITGSVDDRADDIADEGYEADIEIPTWAESDHDLSEKSLEDSCSHRSASTVLEEKKYVLLYPQLCILLFDLLCSQQGQEKSNDENTVYCLQKILALCKDHPMNCTSLSEYNFILRLISGFNLELSINYPAPTQLQLILVEFFFHLARHSIQTHHLAAYLELFKNDDPPFEILLSPLLGLANAMKTQPSFVLNFPMEAKAPSKGENPAEKLCSSICLGHRTAGILSPWNISAVCLPVNVDCGWSMWTDKFSVSLWLRMKNKRSMLRHPGSIYTSAESINSQDSVFLNGNPINSESGESLIHIFSIGHDSFLVEFWGSSVSDTLHIRLTWNDGSSQKILTESCVDGVLPPSLWHHLAINIKDSIQKMLVVIEVTLIVNGSWEIQIPLMFTGILIKKARPTCVLLGDTRSIINAWSLSNFILFRSPLFHKELAFLLCAYGPDFSCLTESNVGDPLPNFINLLDSKSIAASGINWSNILGKNFSMKNLKVLQENLFVLYSARDPESFYIYQHSLSSTTGVISAQQPSLFRISNLDNRASQKVPFSMPAMAMANLSSHKYSGFTQALDALGGLNVLMFLFAKIVELEAEEKYQAHVLYVLLKMASSDNQLYTQFIKGDSYKLILKVLQSQKAKAGYFILKALFDVACDKPGLVQYQPSNNSFFVAPSTNHILVHPELLVSVMLPTWQQWELTEDALSKDSILCLLFKALHMLLGDQHPHREFNVEQLNRCNLLDAVLNFCKQRFLYDDKSLELEPSVCCSIIELLRGLMGAPPQLHQVQSIFKYTLLAHDASSTYITSSRSNFYFLLTADPPSSGKSSKKKGSNRSSKQATRNDSNSTSELSVNQSHRQKVAPVDATKLSKALTNLQIQQNLSSDNYSSEQNPSIESSQLEDINEFDAASNSKFDTVEKWKDVNNGFESVDRFIAECEEKNANLALSRYYDRTDSGPKERKNTIEACDIVIIGMDGEFHEDSSIDLSSEDSKKGKIEKFLAENTKENAVKSRKNIVERSSEYLIMEGLLVLLRDTFLVLPDHMVTVLIDKIIDAASLLAMLNHSDDRVRTAVIKVFSAYLQRCSEDMKSKFINRMKGFYHLANQLSLYNNSSPELVETCVALVTGCHWLPLEEQLEAYDPLQDSLSSHQLAAIPTILAFLPTSIANVNLMENLVHFLHTLYSKVTEAAKQMLEFGLIEVMCKTLVEIAHRNGPDSEQVIDQLQQFFSSIVTNAVHSQGSSSIHVLNETLLMLCFLENEECITCGAKSECIRLLRDVHRAVLEIAVDTIQDMITSQQIRTNTVTRLRNTTAAILSVLSSSYEEEKDVMTQSTMTSSFSNSMSNLSFTTNMSTPSVVSVSKPKQISRGELVDRFKVIINHCMDFTVFTELPGYVCEGETEFACHLFTVLLAGVAAVVDKKSALRTSSNWSMVMWRSRDILRNQAATLFLWLLAPFQSDNVRMFAINTISNEVKVKDILFSLLLTNTQIEQKFILFLWDLMYNGSSLLPTEMQVCEELKEQLLAWDIVSAQAFGHAHDRWQKDVSQAVKEFDAAKLEWEKSVEPSITKCIFKWETMVGMLSELGSTMTSDVVEVQNRERKELLEFMKIEHSKAVDATMRWHSIVQQLTHERAVWYIADSYLRAWQLDPTEGPGRIRNRLQRCNLNINNKFFKMEYRNKHALPVKIPLSYLQTKNCDAKNVLLIDKLHTSEKIVHMCTCQIVQPSSEVSGELLIGDASIYFIPNNSTEDTSDNLDMTSLVMKFDEIKEYHNRRYQLQERAIEMFLLNGRTYLIAFQSSSERDGFVKILSECPLPNRVNGDVLIDAVQLWREGLLSNWDYLTLLNKMSGRSFNDLMQYPVMPFILADYTSQVLDLTNPASFRNLKKPMAVQDKKNEQHYIGSYNYLKHELTDAVSMMTPYQEPYHYGSHYSNSGTVLHFLVRVPPFTQMFLNYQDKNFDLPDRTFHSLHTTWRLTSSESTTDVKEIIPEFFYLPEFLTNPHGFNFGLRQNGERVDDVKLPPWANADPRMFILIHRQALESEYVRENLPHWIDLVFGYKQTGKPAVDAINVFHPATYYGFDVDSIPDSVERLAWQTMIKTYGQTPRQLFTAPHPMIVQTLTPKISFPSRPVYESVKGLQWGSFVGSPAEQIPSVVWRHQHRSAPVASLVPLLTNDVFGLAPKTSLLLSYAKERTLSLVSREDTVLGCAVASWGHTDNVIRLKIRKEKPPKPIIRTSPSDPVTICASAPDCSQLWVGHESGSITVYRYTFNYSQGSVDLNQEPVKLLGHIGLVLSLSVNRAFSIVVSGSADGSAIIWDLNKLSYVRSIPAINPPISLVCVSSTLGDIITIGSETDHSILRLHSINLTLIGSLTSTLKITSVCFSTAPEGLSVNVIATGMENGTVKLWSTWDLSPVGEISILNSTSPIIGLTYSHDSQHLYASAADGVVVIWEGTSNKSVGKTPNFLNLTL